ncbi:MarR family winged helix-turn-helix transcriptional regulator [Jatrophihabitans fulvus]
MKTADLIWLGERLADLGRHQMRAQLPDVPTTEFVIMRHLVEHAPCTIGSLASRTGYAQSRVSAAVASLVDRGWAQTGSDPSDGRRTLVSVPPRIRRAATTGLDAEATGLDEVLASRPAATRRAVLAGLDDLLEILRDTPTAG